MLISSSVYLLLFDLLCRKISKEAYPNYGQEAALQEIEFAETSHKGKIVNISEHYLCSSFSYFINLRTKAWSKKTVSIQSIRFVKAVEYIDGLFEDEQYSGLDWDEHADYLKSQFERKIQEKQYIYLESITQKAKGYRKGDIDPLQELAFQNSRVSIEQYLNYLSEQNYFEAWKLLTPRFQYNSILNGNFLKFKAGFFATLSINSISIFDFSNDNYKVNCTVSFDEKTALYPELDSQTRKRINQKIINTGSLVNEKFVKDVINDIVANRNGVYFVKPESDWSNNLLYEPNRYKWFGSNFTREQLQMIFPNSEVQLVNRVYKYTCVLFEGRWLIDNIIVDGI